MDSVKQNYLKLQVIRMCKECDHKYYVCTCVCGNLVKLDYRQYNYGGKRSCGCLHIDTARKQGKNNTTHGAKSNGKVTPEYRSWASMKNRCNNPKDKAYYRYGGRGITVCKEWSVSFEKFLKDVGIRPSNYHSLDRINNNGNYEPGNVRWATAKQQANNRRSNKNASC